MQIHPIPSFTDNYIFHFLTDNNLSVVVDPGDEKPVIQYLEENDLDLDFILLTHHHHDHIGGVESLKSKYHCDVWGPATETKRIPFMDKLLEDEQTYALDSYNFHVIHTPGHTLGHICLYFENQNVLFAGDTLFSLGCGRVFEGTMEQMFNSLQKLKNLPNKVHLYCAHEYTLSNAKFLQSLNPGSPEHKELVEKITDEREKGKITIPSTLSFEKRFNPFFTAKTVEDFEARRLAKDNF